MARAKGQITLRGIRVTESPRRPELEGWTCPWRDVQLYGDAARLFTSDDEVAGLNSVVVRLGTVRFDIAMRAQTRALHQQMNDGSLVLINRTKQMPRAMTIVLAFLFSAFMLGGGVAIVLSGGKAPGLIEILNERTLGDSEYQVYVTTLSLVVLGASAVVFIGMAGFLVIRGWMDLWAWRVERLTSTSVVLSNGIRSREIDMHSARIVRSELMCPRLIESTHDGATYRLQFTPILGRYFALRRDTSDITEPIFSKKFFVWVVLSLLGCAITWALVQWGHAIGLLDIPIPWWLLCVFAAVGIALAIAARATSRVDPLPRQRRRSIRYRARRRGLARS